MEYNITILVQKNPSSFKFYLSKKLNKGPSGPTTAEKKIGITITFRLPSLRLSPKPAINDNKWMAFGQTMKRPSHLKFDP